MHSVVYLQLNDVRRGHKVLQRLLVSDCESLKELEGRVAEFTSIETDAYEPEELAMMLGKMRTKDIPTAVPKWLLDMNLFEGDELILDATFKAVHNIQRIAVEAMEEFGPHVSSSSEEYAEWGDESQSM